MSKFEEIIEDFQPKADPPLAEKLKIENYDGIYKFLPEISDFLKTEIEFHDQIYQDEEEVHQLNALRNKFYHDYFKKWIYKLSKDSVILEVGGGSGYDLLPLLEKSYSVIESDISIESIKFIKSKIDNKYPQYKNQIIYLVSDGQNLPLDSNSIEATFMVASFHHFQDQQKAMAEIKRVTKKGGLIILAMEPSRFMMWFTKLFQKSKILRIHQGYSEADETHAGYAKSEFIKILSFKPAVLKIKRVWLICGFLHYGLEAIYRIFKLKKRIKIPKFIEAILIVIDEILLKIPIVNLLNFHWIIIIKNDS